MFKYLLSIFLLLGSSLRVAHAATLDCTSPNDDNNHHHYENDSEAATSSSSSSSSCRLNLSYEEIANAISGSSNNQGASPLLNCQPGKDGIECTFPSTAIENHKYKNKDNRKNRNNNNNNNPVVVSHVKPIFDEVCASVVSSSSSGGEEEKMNSYYFCIGSKWATRWSMQNTGDVAAAEANSGAEAAETDGHQPPRQQQHQEELRGEETVKRETGEQVLATTESGGGGFSIRIGNHYYKEPFDEYHESVTNVLKARAHLWKKTLSSQGDDVAHEYSIGNAQMDIGVAHYSTVINSDGGMEEEATGTGSEALDLKLAVNAFQEAERTYQYVLEKYEHERHVLHSSLGGLYLQWGEVYQSPYFELDDEGEDNEQAHQSINDLSLFYYGKAETHYRLCIETGKNFLSEEFIRDTETNLAHVLHRMGRSLVSSVSEMPAAASMLYDDVASSGSTTTTATANSQIHKIMTAIPKAEKKFQQAVSLYRKAIDSEKDFARQVDLKNHLCTTLLDAGNGVAYASDYAKAISLQEEGIDICQDLLQHLSGGNYQFMLQYIGESMYGVANHYMMLGKYDATSASYQAAMDWFERYHLHPATNVIVYDVPDESLEAYEKQLEDYLQLKTEISIPDGYVDEYSVQYRPNPAYEGELHGALGAIHLSRNEILMAIEHFNEAILLYENFDGEENLDRSIADCKVRCPVVVYCSTCRHCCTCGRSLTQVVLLLNISLFRHRRVWLRLISKMASTARARNPTAMPWRLIKLS